MATMPSSTWVNLLLILLSWITSAAAAGAAAADNAASSKVTLTFAPIVISLRKTNYTLIKTKLLMTYFPFSRSDFRNQWRYQV
jgi:hypothetical protein